jgi:CubicO group peptidase (beta-lactamase class C family)
LPEEILETIYTAELRSTPGSTFMYCNATSILLGILVERVFNKKLDTLADEFFFKPLGMKNSTFSPDRNKMNEIVPTEIDEWRGREIQGEIHDESAWVLRKIITPGSAGLFSCVPDLLVFVEMLLNEGTYKSQQYFSPDTIKLLSTNQIAEIGESTGLGWELNQAVYMGTDCSGRTIGKTGFTGCVVIVDLKKGIGFTLLSNYTWPHRKEGKEQINYIRRQVADVVFGGL